MPLISCCLGTATVSHSAGSNASHERVISEQQHRRGPDGPWAVVPTDGLCHTSTYRRRKAFAITETELKLMAAAAIIGLNNNPRNGYSTPAAIGTPREL